MPSYLGEYAGCAKNRSEKFVRAVNSFLAQNYQNKELVVVSDGCEETNSIVKNKYSSYDCIKLVTLPKQPTLSGMVRQAGINAASGKIICYLDTDDYLGAKHLSSLVSSFGDCTLFDWCYFDDSIKYFHLDHLPLEKRNAELKLGCIGTSNIAHLNYIDINWNGCDGYGHDFVFIQNMAARYGRFNKVGNMDYVVCHLQNGVDV